MIISQVHTSSLQNSMILETYTESEVVDRIPQNFYSLQRIILFKTTVIHTENWTIDLFEIFI
jgi:hypothetical protein